MVGTVLSQKPRRLQRFRNESSFARSDAEQRPDHAGRQYVILASMVARNTSWRDSSRDSVTTEDSHHIQQTAARRQQVVYMIRHSATVALSRSLSVMPRTLAQLTRSVFRHSGGGWDDWPHFSRMKISSFDFVRSTRDYF